MNWISTFNNICTISTFPHHEWFLIKWVMFVLQDTYCNFLKYLIKPHWRHHELNEEADFLNPSSFLNCQSEQYWAQNFAQLNLRHKSSTCLRWAQSIRNTKFLQNKSNDTNAERITWEVWKSLTFLQHWSWPNH